MKCIQKKIMNKLFFVKNNITVIVVFYLKTTSSNDIILKHSIAIYIRQTVIRTMNANDGCTCLQERQRARERERL